MKKIAFIFIIIISIIYILICVSVYFNQEDLIFFPKYLDKNYKFYFSQQYEEKYFLMKDKIKLNALLFKTQKPKGLIFFLHGNAGCIDKWGNVAKIYTDLGYDFFILDYRGYGKSEGKIENENQLHEDVKTVYNEIIKNYNHSKNIIIGYSLGTCMAAKLASETMPQKLILQAPYYSMSLIMEEHYSLLPTFLLNYKLETYYYLKNCNMPVTIFHGDNDDVIDCTSSIKLEMQFKKGDTLIILKGQDHNNLNENKEYLEYINKSL